MTGSIDVPAGATPEQTGTELCRAFDSFSRAHLRAGRGRESWESFVARLSSEIAPLSASERQLGLLWMLRHQPYVYQNLAGELLLRSSDPCLVPLEEMLEIVCANFNLSARSTVTYMTRFFGRERVLEAVTARARQVEPRSDARVRLHGVAYFLGAASSVPED